MNKLTKLVGATAAATLVALSGTAFTNSIGSLPTSDVVGYGATTVSGATLDSLTYKFDAPKSSIQGVTLVLQKDTTTAAVELAFNDAAPTTCGTGIYNGTTLLTTYNCPQTIATADLTKTAVFVS